MPEHCGHLLCGRLFGGAAIFNPGCECDSPAVPSEFDRLMSGYGLIRTAVLGDPYARAYHSSPARIARCTCYLLPVAWYLVVHYNASE